jgi:acyl-CoA synthetase (AMP-forming)/AMP-acid ligase II
VSTTAATPATVLDGLRELLERVPERRLFIQVDASGQDGRSLTVAALAADTERVRRRLVSAGARPGDRAVLLYLPSLDFVGAFLGCLAAGVIPVPLAPPNPFRPGREADVLRAVVDQSGAALVLTHEEYASVVDRDADWVPSDWIATHGGDPGQDPDAAADGAALAAWHRPFDLDAPAFLQYTSGSTGAPKGVVVSHRNISHELVSIARDLCLGDDTTAVTWVPHFHDLGLISFLLNTVVGHSARTYVLSPLDFLADPALWFDVISRVRATHTAAPNFAFDLVVRRSTAEQRAAWDLGSLRVLGSSGELIRPATVERFLAAFAPCGLDPAAFYPTYGLAEHTLSLTMGGTGPLTVDRGALDRGIVQPVWDRTRADVVSYYGCGRITKPGARLRVVDPRTRLPLPDGTVGEIWVDSVTKARGYWNDPAATAETFAATLADGDPHTYLRTGDLGFLIDEELFVCGRLKEVIIIRGHNYYPQDLEDSVRHCHPLIRPGGVAAFAAEAAHCEAEGTEHLVLFAETSAQPSGDELRDVRRAVRAVLRKEHGVGCQDVVVGPRGMVLKTTSGKVRRMACRDAYRSGTAASWEALGAAAKPPAREGAAR